MPKDPAEPSPSLPTAASKWKEEHLKMLNVDYSPEHFYPIDVDVVIPPDVSKRTYIHISSMNSVDS
jgi:hypothetical protein